VSTTPMRVGSDFSINSPHDSQLVKEMKELPGGDNVIIVDFHTHPEGDSPVYPSDDDRRHAIRIRSMMSCIGTILNPEDPPIVDCWTIDEETGRIRKILSF